MPEPLNERQRAILVEVSELSPITIADLACNINATVSATRSAVRRLERRDYVMCDAYQQPAARWFLTDKGERTVRALGLHA